MSTAFDHNAPLVAERYTIERPLAVGGMAEIYLATAELGLGVRKAVVIKRLREALVADARAVQMFADEARITAQLAHPLVVQAFDAGEDGGVPYIVMEYVRGEELNQLARRGLGMGRFMPRHLAVEILRQAALALGYCHSLELDGEAAELIHCDVSPNNLLVTSDGQVKLIDFGIAQFAGQRRRDEAAVPGKLSYMSPEQARCDRLDHRSDIFALGVMLYEMTLGRRLFRGPASEVRERILSGDVQPPTFCEHDYPGHLESIVMRALELHPSERHQSGYELADELARYLVSEGTPVGAVEVVRYLDELERTDGAGRRPELFADEADADDLDFDRHVASVDSASLVGVDVSQWDELDEDDSAVAAALGIDVGRIRRSGSAGGTWGRVAVPVDDAPVEATRESDGAREP